MAGLTVHDRVDFVEDLREAAAAGWMVIIRESQAGGFWLVGLRRRGDDDVDYVGATLDEAIEKFVDGWPSRALATAVPAKPVTSHERTGR